MRTSTNWIIQIIGKLSATNHNFKYIVNCIILAAGGNGMDVAGLCYWDQEMDGSVTIKWDNKSMTCIVNIFGCAVWSYIQSKCNHFSFTIFGNWHPFLAIFYFYVIRIILSHFSLSAIFLSFLRSGSSPIGIDAFDSDSFWDLVDLWYEPRNPSSLWLKYDVRELLMGWYFRQ